MEDPNSISRSPGNSHEGHVLASDFEEKVHMADKVLPVTSRSPKRYPCYGGVKGMGSKNVPVSNRELWT